MVNHSCEFSANDDAVVAVIDGSNLLITNFRGAIVPPPMSSCKIESQHSINFVDFINCPATTSYSNSFYTIDTSNTISIYAAKLKEHPQEIPLLGKFKIHLECTLPLLSNHIVWVNDSTLVLSQTIDGAATQLYLCKLAFEEASDAIRPIDVLDSLKIPEIVGIITCSKSNNLIIQTASAKMISIQINANQKLNDSRELFQLPEFCETVKVYDDIDNKFNIFSLKHKQTLYLNGKSIATLVTSIFATEKYLMFTTLDQLKFVRLSDATVVNERRMERGGRIVVVVPKDSKCVLQMPRGNLEMIQPRVLSLCIIADHLNSSEYKQAFDILRKQRINLNLLIDHNPEKFLNELALFIENIDNAQWLNLFLADLANDDVTVTMYSSNYKTNSEDRKEIIENKIDLVCNKVCDIINGSDNCEKLLLPVLTSHVKQKHLDVALKIVWNLKQKESANKVASAGGDNITSQEALKYLLYLVDVNELYNVALGMYDFGLVLFVASKSQKDPKEYLPFLNELKQMNETYRKYKIDLYLKRYASALKHIVNCGAEKLDEALELIGKENLFTTAMRLYADQRECYNKVVYSFAEKLREKGKFRDACLMYERSGALQQAILSARHILDWQKCITLSVQLGSSEEEIKQLIG